MTHPRDSGQPPDHDRSALADGRNLGSFLGEERLAQATRLAQLGFWVWDSIEDRCIYCSEEHARIHGLSVEEYVERSSKIEGPFSLTHPEDRERYRRSIQRLRQHGEGFEIETRVVQPSGEVRYVREISQPVRDDQGVVIQEFGTTQDITRTKLAEQQLRHSHKMEAVGQLTGGLAHDFNNLLAVVVGNLQLAQSQIPQQSDLQRLLNNAIAAAERGAALTHHLLAFSRKQSLRPRVVQADALVSGLVELLRSTLGEIVRIEVSSDSDLWLSEVDPGQLENAIVNLALNARDAMNDGGVLAISTTNSHLEGGLVGGVRQPGLGEINVPDAEASEPVAGDFVAIRVSDTGSGMSAETRARAFEPFFTTKGVGKGSGLGLSMVYGFVRQSGGAVAIDSEPGKGTTITLLLPRAVIPAPQPEHEAARAPATVRGEGTVLVVEDEATLRDLIASMLESLGYRAVTAGNGKEALEQLERLRPDLLLVDVVLPDGIHGPQLAEQCLASDPTLRVLFMSGYAGRELDKERMAEIGALLIKKPFKREQLGEMVRSLLAG